MPRAATTDRRGLWFLLLPLVGWDLGACGCGAAVGASLVGTAWSFQGEGPLKSHMPTGDGEGGRGGIARAAPHPAQNPTSQGAKSPTAGLWLDAPR